MAKIMAVDDEPDILNLVVMVLQSAGHEVTPCASGMECLNKLRSMKPDLILLDVQMPVIDGHQTLKQIKQVDANLKVAFLSVLGISDTEKEAVIKEGALDYLRKPFTPEGLLGKVSELLAK